MEQNLQSSYVKITPALKKKIIKDWYESLPGLTLTKPMSLDRRIGPLLIGIGFSASRGHKSDSYAPGFSVHNFSRPRDFLAAMLSIDFVSVNARWHHKFYRDAVENVKKQVYLPLEGPVSLEQVINAYKNYVEKHNYPHQMIGLLEDPALIAAWAGEEQRAQEALEWGYQTLEAWNHRTLEKGSEVSAERNADIWRVKMEKLIADPEVLRQTTRDEVIKHKLTMIPCEDFTDTSYRENRS